MPYRYRYTYICQYSFDYIIRRAYSLRKITQRSTKLAVWSAVFHLVVYVFTPLKPWIHGHFGALLIYFLSECHVFFRNSHNSFIFRLLSSFVGLFITITLNSFSFKVNPPFVHLMQKRANVTNFYLCILDGMSLAAAVTAVPLT